MAVLVLFETLKTTALVNTATQAVLGVQCTTN